MDIPSNLRAVWRWKFLIFSIALTCTFTAIVYSYQLPRAYSADAVGLVSPKQLIPPSGGLTQQDFNQLPSSDQLIETYVGLINSEPVRERLVKSGIPRGTRMLKDEISATRRPNSTLVDISIVDGDPVVAQTIAQQVIPAFNSSLADLQASVGDPKSKLDSLIAWEIPTVPNGAPISPNIPRNALLALVVGVLLGLGVAAALEHLDNTIKTDADIPAKLGLSLLGSVASRVDLDQESSPGGVAQVAATRTTDPLAEQYRGIRTNLLFRKVDAALKTIVVSSTNPAEGKTTTACNLATVLAQSGNRVILVDADFRRPAMHRIFNLDRSVGLGNLILGDRSKAEVLMPTSDPNLRVICAGPAPPNPSELLGSMSMRRVLGELQKGVEFVVLDTPPLSAVTDATVLAALCDGVVLVIERGGCSVKAIERGLENLRGVGANVLGAVLNRARETDANSYYYYGDQDPAARTAEFVPVVPPRRRRAAKGAEPSVQQ